MSTSNTENEFENTEHIEPQKKDISAGKIKVILQGSNNDSRVTCLVNPNAKVSKLLNAFCKEKGVNSKEYRLVYKGKFLQENQEISAYSISDESKVEVVASQTGGSTEY